MLSLSRRFLSRAQNPITLYLRGKQERKRGLTLRERRRERGRERALARVRVTINIYPSTSNSGIAIVQYFPSGSSHSSAAALAAALSAPAFLRKDVRCFDGAPLLCRSRKALTRTICFRTESRLSELTRPAGLSALGSGGGAGGSALGLATFGRRCFPSPLPAIINGAVPVRLIR